MGRVPTRDEGIVEVGPEVLDVLAADAEPEQGGWQVLLAGDGGAAFDGRFDRAETGGVPDDPQGLADGVRAGRVAANVEGDHGSVAAHEAARGRVRRMRGEAGVADRADLGMLLQTDREVVSGGGCALEAQAQRPHAAHREVRLQRAGSRSGKQASLAKPSGELVVPSNRG